MKKTNTRIFGVYILEPEIHHDNRGCFLEGWNKQKFKDLGIKADFIQHNQSYSVKGVLRGLHYQTEPFAQGKLVWVSDHGIVCDVFVDLRKDSPTYGEWDSVQLFGARRLWIPPGLAHGFLTLSDDVSFDYLVTAPWDKQSERTLLWNDPHLNIDWPKESWNIEEIIVSEKDQQGHLFKDYQA